MKEVEIAGNKVKVASTVDAIGLYCPMPVVKLKLELESLKLNQVVELLGDDPGMVEDLPAWCKETENTLLSLEGNPEGLFVVYVKKTKQ